MQGSVGPRCYCFTIATRKEVGTQEHRAREVLRNCNITTRLSAACLPSPAFSCS